jgi:hypothetical protein
MELCSPFAVITSNDRAARFPILIKPLRMLRDGGNANEENQDADDVGLEPQDRIGVHG